MSKPFELQQLFVPSSGLSCVEWPAVHTLLLALECRDAETYHHSLRVAELATRTCQALGLKHNILEEVLISGLLHDIGKIGLPDRVLQKAGRLSKSERGLIAMHPEISSSILTPLPNLGRVRDIIRQHHERFDGTGYPEGRRGDEILIEGRVLAISDAYDALCAERPYRDPLTSEEAIGWIESEVGRQFCPISFQATLQVLETHCPTDGMSKRHGHQSLVSLAVRQTPPSELIYLLTNT